MTELNKMSNRKNYFGALAGRASPRRPAESKSVFTGRRRRLIVMSGAARLGLKGPQGRGGGGKAASGAQRLIKGSSVLMQDDLCKQCSVGGERSGNILCD